MSKNHLINANIHRAKEGARVLEDIARYVLRDESLFHQIRKIRHHIQVTEPIYDVTTDLGGIDLIENNIRHDLISLIQANSLRLQEALRVLEELATTAENKHQIKNLRYAAYDTHSKMYYSAKKYLKSELLAGLYLIIDTDVIPYPLDTIIDMINQSPVNMVQYRNKSASKKAVFEGAYRIKQLLNKNKLFIINDHIDIALDLGDGVHIGQDDYPLTRIRHIIPDDFIFGVSCHTLEEARIAEECGASYIAFGCLFETNSKKDITPVSLQELQHVCKNVSPPVCAIGGIKSDNLHTVLTADIKMAALISYVWKTDHPLQTINDMHKRIVEK